MRTFKEMDIQGIVYWGWEAKVLKSNWRHHSASFLPLTTLSLAARRLTIIRWILVGNTTSKCSESGLSS